MRGWLQPTLSRRLIGALMVAVLFFAVVVLAQDQLDIDEQIATNPGVRQTGLPLAAELDEVDDPVEAARMVDHLARVFNRQRQPSEVQTGRLLFQLYDRSGRLLYASADADPIARPGVGEQVLAGRNHWTWRHDGPRWSLRIAEPAISRGALFRFSCWELVKVMLPALPLMLLPIWLAVRTGMRPLRRFTRRIREMDAGQALAPLGMDLRYAELRPLGQAFDTLLLRLRERLQREQAFVHDAAHELRTPLAVIAAQAHVLAHAREPAARAEASAAMSSAIARSAHLAQQLLDLAALDGRASAPPDVVDLSILSAQLLAAQVGLARSRDIALSLEAPEKLPARLDRAAFQSILQNLLDNALRYVHEGARIEIELSPIASDGLRLVVADDGPGIDAQDHARIFDRFWRGSGHDQPGSGLGLAIVRQAATRLGGHVSVGTGLDGRGIRFELTVPASV
ncbi:sensor histidine kinase [Roseateles chitosanitabidus]|uniref:sensor histidine kinase n=1 Tax=Roseateles chitosanitabidus TaxID=65048 RepID=UPI00082B488D|nr:HAMP domain-containing sensor histidine kinase [Roseateles chitosanitabidus]